MSAKKQVEFLLPKSNPNRAIYQNLLTSRLARRKAWNTAVSMQNRSKRTMGSTRQQLSDHAWLERWPRLLASESDLWVERLLRELPWHHESYRMFGKEVIAPRLVTWHGDSDASYRYSGVSHSAEPWTESLSELRSIVEQTTGLKFNSVLGNLYRSGSDGMGWHADDEREVGPSVADRHVASLSFGDSRRFLLRNRDTGAKTELGLGCGDLLLMRGSTQDEFQHSIRKTKKSVGVRINLTFRVISGPR